MNSKHLPPSKLPSLLGFGALAAALLLLVVMWTLTGPVSQDPRYHNFADQRTLLGVPNALNVISNLALLLVGAWGVIELLNDSLHPGRIRVLYLVLFSSVIAVALGSSYYHWFPDNQTLVWDRLPMTVTFMAFASLVAGARFGEKYAIRSFPVLVVAGVFSIVYWVAMDDLRPYALVQFGPMAVLPFLVWKLHTPCKRWLWATFLLYLLAKILEVYDAQLFVLCNGLVSGHSLKHFASALGVFAILYYSRCEVSLKSDPALERTV